MATTAADLSDLDAFIDELQRALLVEGARSEAVRYLKRFAREQTDREFDRVFEIKLAEHRYFSRETSPPSPWKLPMRFMEGLWDDVRFTPKKEAMGTLLYVVVVLLGIEAFKLTVFREKPTPPATAEIEPVGDRKVEHWLFSELNHAAKQTDFGSLLLESAKNQLRDPRVAAQFFEALYRASPAGKSSGLAPASKSDAFSESLEKELQSVVELAASKRSPEDRVRLKDQMKAKLLDAVRSGVFMPVTQQKDSKGVDAKAVADRRAGK